MKLSMQRKKQSEKILKVQKIPLNRYLPIVLDDDEAVLRSKEEILDRAFALAIVSGKAMGGSINKVREFVQIYGDDPLFTSQEQSFLSSPLQNEQEVINFTWKLESLWVLLWCLGLISKMGEVKDLCDVDLAFETILGVPKKALMKKVEMKTLSPVLDELDLVFRMHWAVKEAQIKGMDAPIQLNPGVVLERHYTLNWLTGDENWDEVSTNT